MRNINITHPSLTKEEAQEIRSQNREEIEKLYLFYEDIIITGEEPTLEVIKENLEAAHALKNDYRFLQSLENFFPGLRQHTLVAQVKSFSNIKVSNTFLSSYKNEISFSFKELNAPLEEGGMADYILDRIFISLKNNAENQEAYMLAKNDNSFPSEKRIWFKDLDKTEYLANPSGWILLASDKPLLKKPLKNHLKMFPSILTGLESLKIQKSDFEANILIKICDIDRFNAFFPDLVPQTAECSYVINSNLIGGAKICSFGEEGLPKQVSESYGSQENLSRSEQIDFIHEIQGLEDINETEFATPLLYSRTINGYEALYKEREEELIRATEMKQANEIVERRFRAREKLIFQEERKFLETRFSHLNENNLLPEYQKPKRDSMQMRATEKLEAFKLKDKIYISYLLGPDINAAIFTILGDKEKKVLGKGILHHFKPELSLSTAEKITATLHEIDLFLSRMEKEMDEVNIFNLEIYLRLLKEVRNPTIYINLNIQEAEKVLSQIKEIKASLKQMDIKIEYENHDAVYYYIYKKDSDAGFRLKCNEFGICGQEIAQIFKNKNPPLALAAIEDIDALIIHEEEALRDEMKKAENENILENGSLAASDCSKKGEIEILDKTFSALPAYITNKGVSIESRAERLQNICTFYKIEYIMEDRIQKDSPSLYNVACQTYNMLPESSESAIFSRSSYKSEVPRSRTVKNSSALGKVSGEKFLKAS